MARRSTAANLQRVVLATTLLVAAFGLLRLWPRSPLIAVALAVAIVFLHAWVLAVEFLLLPFASRGDPAPRPSTRARWRAWWAETWFDVRVFAWRQPFAWNAIPDYIHPGIAAGRTGAVFIHGFVCNRGFWNPWLREMIRLGHPYVAINLEPLFGSIDDYVDTVGSAVRQVTAATGVPPVLVCHSMGGLAARAWLGLCRDPDAVARVVTIATPHRGAWLARFSRTRNGRQMRTSSDWLRQLDEQWPPRFAARLTCWYSNCDNVVAPPTAATLPGADNRFIPGRAHVELAFDSQVMQETFALLRIPHPSREAQDRNQSTVLAARAPDASS